MNWGLRIILLYTAFVGGMLFLVYKCTQQNIDLVSADYYAQEIKYQEKIDRLNNSQHQDVRLEVAYAASEGMIQIKYPASSTSKNTTGEIVLFRPDNSKLDFKIPIDIIDGIQNIPSQKLIKGLWRVKSSWSTNDTPYYQEERIIIQ
ncbi:MAG: FixH family protein [Bacteroidetes bacterium]|nr:FixH family protein [Bacteroidota bacterium]